jgi:hypothetical protein
MHRIEPLGYMRDLLCLLPRWPKHHVLDLAPVNWTQTVAQTEVQQALAANVFRQVVLGQRTWSRPAPHAWPCQKYAIRPLAAARAFPDGYPYCLRRECVKSGRAVQSRGPESFPEARTRAFIAAMHARAQDSAEETVRVSSFADAGVLTGTGDTTCVSKPGARVSSRQAGSPSFDVPPAQVEHVGGRLRAVRLLAHHAPRSAGFT